MHRLLRLAALSVPLALLPTAALVAQSVTVKPEPELGIVTWHRDFDVALAEAGKAKKPVLLLFQEIPGCATCTGFGKDVLSHPLLVTAIEQCFVPVVVRNNVDGREKDLLQRFDEPAWNNPVVRFVDGLGKDLVARKDGVFDVHGIAVRMVAALEAAKVAVPGYLRVARDESDRKTEKAVFAMHCFWEGEAVLGALEGVVATSSAFVDGAEVVEVTFRPSVLAPAKLTEHAQQKSCKPVAVAGGKVKPAPASDQQHALGGTAFGKLALTPMQRTKVHSALTLGTDPKAWLTPAQVEAVTAKK